MTPTRVAVTGGAGFIGSNLALHLKQTFANCSVLAVDNLKRRGAELNLPRLQHGGVEFIHGDVRNPEDLDSGPPADLLIECSAEPSVLAGVGSSPEYVIRTNLVGTLNLLEYCRRHGTALLFLSTSRVYPIDPLCRIALEETPARFEIAARQELPGVSPRGISEVFPLTGARSLYGASKLAAELFIEEYAACYGLRALVNRCGVVAGPWQMGKVDQGVVALWVARHLFGRELTYIGFGGSGKQVRDVVHVADLCALIEREIAQFENVAGRTLNVGGGRAHSFSLRELTALCQEVTGRTVPIRPVLEARSGDVPVYVTDNTNVTAAVGWEPTRDVRTLVQDVHAWLQTHRGLLESIVGT